MLNLGDRIALCVSPNKGRQPIDGVVMPGILLKIPFRKRVGRHQ